MIDHIELGPTPGCEDCAQVGSENYQANARRECNAYMAQLIRKFGPPPGTAMFRVKRNPHDFGSYLEVAIYYDDKDETQVSYAWGVEADCPSEWDDTARAELQLEAA